MYRKNTFLKNAMINYFIMKKNPFIFKFEITGFLRQNTAALWV